MTNRVELAIAERFRFADGHEFGAVGRYERLVGRAHFAVDPHVPAQRGVTDVDKAAFQKATASVYNAFPKWTPGLHDKIEAILKQ